MAIIEIDQGSGFCFGVVTAIRKAEEELDKSGHLYCLGDIVHNSNEVERLERKGLETITHEQLKKLHNVKQVKLLEQGSSVERELLLVKIRNTPENRNEIMAATEIYRAKIIDYTTSSLCVEVTGEPSKINAFIEVVKPLGIVEMCRTGVVALERGDSILKK